MAKKKIITRISNINPIMPNIIPNGNQMLLSNLNLNNNQLIQNKTRIENLSQLMSNLNINSNPLMQNLATNQNINQSLNTNPNLIQLINAINQRTSNINQNPNLSQIIPNNIALNPNININPILSNINNNINSSQVLSNINQIANRNQINPNINQNLNINQLIPNQNQNVNLNSPNIKNSSQINQEEKENPEQKTHHKIYIKTVKKKEKNKIPKENIINIKEIESGKETRTVVRISPIPPHFSSFDISKLLDKYLNIEYKKNQRTYKAIYAPLSKVIGKNIGYCFVMLVKPKYVVPFYKTFNGLNFNKKKCKKKCRVTWADVQGDEFLKISDDPLRSPITFTDLIEDEEDEKEEDKIEFEEDLK